jgi:hypothetical protein
MGGAHRPPEREPERNTNLTLSFNGYVLYISICAFSVVFVFHVFSSITIAFTLEINGK